MTDNPHRDPRLEKVETVTVQFETFKKALKRNYLDDPVRHDRSYVLRLCPPFEAEMEASYYESEQGRHYDNNWDEKPFHIAPETIIREGTERGFRWIVNWPTEATVRDALTEEEIEEEGGIDAALAVGREMFWEELKMILPVEFDIAADHPFNTYPAEINWEE